MGKLKEMGRLGKDAFRGEVSAGHKDTSHPHTRVGEEVRALRESETPYLIRTGNLG